MERRTRTSNEVKKRYNDKTYKRYQLSLRYDTDTDLLQQIESETAKGLSASEAIKKLLRNK